MPNLISSDLSDPHPPVPGERERALVAARAHDLGRRRRLVQGGGALAMVAAVAVSVAALTAGGSSGPSGTGRVEAASAPSTAAVAPTAVATPAPATTPATTPAVETPTAPPVVEQMAPIAPVTPAAPSVFSVSGTVSGNPAGTTVTLAFSGVGGEFGATADAAGNYSVSGLAAGDYAVIGTWVDGTSTATASQRFGTITVNGDSTVSFSFSG